MTTYFFISRSFLTGKIFLLAVILATLMVSCTPRVQIPAQPSSPDALWNQLISPDNDQIQSFQSSLSINYIDGKKRTHLTGQLWGNKNGPVRLDLRAGIGKLVAMIAENQNTWLLYDTLQKTAYQGQSDDVCREFGLAFPVSLNVLGAVMLGRVKEILPPKYEQATVTEDGHTIYSFHGKNIHSLRVGPTGLPMELEAGSWQFSWPGWETGNIPPRLRIKSNQTTIFLRLKEYKTYPKKRPGPETELVLPPDTIVIQR